MSPSTYFFIQISGKKLGLLRIFFYSLFLIIVFQFDFSDYGYVEKNLWISPFPSLFFLEELPSSEFLLWLNRLWILFLFFSAIGLLGRLSMVMSFVLSYILLGIPVGFLPSHFQYYLPTVVLGIMAFSKAHDFFSVDSYIKHKKWTREDLISTDYGWTPRLVLFNVVMMYLGAGLGKLRYSGWAWATEGAFEFHITTAHHNFKNNISDTSAQIFEWILVQPYLIPILGLFVLLLELSSPLAFLFKKTLPFYFFAWISFHICVALFMGITVSFWFIPTFAIILFLIISR